MVEWPLSSEIKWIKIKAAKFWLDSIFLSVYNPNESELHTIFGLFIAFWWDSERVNIGTSCSLSLKSCICIFWHFVQTINSNMYIYAESIKRKLCELSVTHCHMLSREPYRGYCVYYCVSYHKENRQTFLSQWHCCVCRSTWAINAFLISLPTIFTTGSHSVQLND